MVTQHVSVEETDDPGVCEADGHFAVDHGFVDTGAAESGGLEKTEAFLNYDIDHVCDEAAVPNDIFPAGFVIGALDFVCEFSDSDQN